MYGNSPFKNKQAAKADINNPTSNPEGSPSVSDNGSGSSKPSNSVDAKIASNPFVSKKVKQMREETKFIREESGPKKVKHEDLSEFSQAVQANIHGYEKHIETDSSGKDANPVFTKKKQGGLYSQKNTGKGPVVGSVTKERTSFNTDKYGEYIPQHPVPNPETGGTVYFHGNKPAKKLTRTERKKSI